MLEVSPLGLQVVSLQGWEGYLFFPCEADRSIGTCALSPPWFQNSREAEPVFSTGLVNSQLELLYQRGYPVDQSRKLPGRESPSTWACSSKSEGKGLLSELSSSSRHMG